MLNSAGIEVSGIEERAILGDKVVVGNVVGLRPHPNADRLRLARVDSGMKSTRLFVVPLIWK